MFDLTGKIALITGAGQGVGEGIAHALAAQGARVVVNDIDADRAQSVAAAITTLGGFAEAHVFDVTAFDAVAAAVTSLESSLGPIDILVNNAGNGGADGMQVGRFGDLDPAAWDGPIRVNLYGVLNCCRAVINSMCDRGWGRVVTISSGAGTAGVAIGVSPYSAGKGGGIGFTRTLALEVARNGVTANTLAIGLMGMPDPDLTASIARSIPVGRAGTPRDVAAAVVWLSSEEAAWVTGQTIQLNGGSITT